MVGMHGRAVLDAPCSIVEALATGLMHTTRRTAFLDERRPIVWCGVLAACGTVWRHGCRHRASKDGFTACPASGEGAAPSTLRVCCRALARPPSRDTPQVRPCRLRRGIHAAQSPATVGGQGPVKLVGMHGRAVLDAPCWIVEASATGLMHTTRQTAFQMSADQLSGAVSSPLAGPCGGMDAATEPPRMDSRRVPQAVRAPRPRRCECAAGPSPAHHRETRRKYVHVGSGAASMPLRVPRR
ncbi:hypothetical protein FHR53_000319 [Xanthomonas arboricola]